MIEACCDLVYLGVAARTSRVHDGREDRIHPLLQLPVQSQTLDAVKDTTDPIDCVCYVLEVPDETALVQ